MSFLGETILLGPRENVPNNFAFFKRVTIPGQRMALPRGTKVKIYANKGWRPVRHPMYTFPEGFVLEIDNGRVDTREITVSMREPMHYTFHSWTDIIVEEDPIAGVIVNPRLENINEDELMAEIIAHPELGEKIPRVLWERPSFLYKITQAGLGRFIPEQVKTLAKVKGLNYFGKMTGTFDDPKVPGDVSRSINEYLDMDQSRLPNIEASTVASIRKKEREIKSCKQPGTCSVSGGRKKRRKRTRKN